MKQNRTISCLAHTMLRMPPTSSCIRLDAIEHFFPSSTCPQKKKAQNVWKWAGGGEGVHTNKRNGHLIYLLYLVQQVNHGCDNSTPHAESSPRYSLEKSPSVPNTPTPPPPPKKNAHTQNIRLTQRLTRKPKSANLDSRFRTYLARGICDTHPTHKTSLRSYY